MTRIARSLFLVSASVCTLLPLARSQGQTYPASIVGILECTVPDLETFVLHGAFPVPRGFSYDVIHCPFTVYDTSGAPLPTQWRPIAWRADHSLMTVELMAVVERGDMEVDSRQRFGVRHFETPQDILPFQDKIDFIEDVRLRSEDAYGNRYLGTLEFARRYRFGPAVITAEFTARLLPLEPDATGALEQLGAVQIWFTFRAGTDAVEIALNFHNASSEHPSANLYFKNLELVLPAGYHALSLWPEPMAGAMYEQGSARVLPLIREIGDGRMHFLEQRHERGFRYFAFPLGEEGWRQALWAATRKGWAVALDVELDPSTGRRTWSFQNPETAGFLPQGLPMPDLSHLPNLGSALESQRRDLWEQLGTHLSVGPGAGRNLPDGFRNPYGVQYGGMTGAVNIHPYDGVATLATGAEGGLLQAYAIMRCYNDRQTGAMYEDNGASFQVDDYRNSDGTLPFRMFGDAFQVSYPDIVHDEPWRWSQADRSHELMIEAEGAVPPYRDSLLNWDSIDTQHIIRYARMIKALVYLDNDPLARRRLEALCELLRGTYYEGPGGRLAAFANAEPNIGSGFGREHAEFLDVAATAYACGDDAWRARWRPVFEVALDGLSNVQTPGGVWQAFTSGKIATDPPFGDGSTAFYRVMRPNEHAYTLHGLRGMKEAVFAEGVDPARYEEARRLLREGGLAVLDLLWRWKEDLSGPLGNGTWDRVAVGELGPLPTMFTNHNDLPAEQFRGGVVLDSHTTGLALTYWFGEAPGPTALVRTALEAYFGSADLLGAVRAEGTSNLGNNAALLGLVQQSL